MDDKYLQLVLKLLDKNDPYKSGHSERVSKLTEVLGINMGFPEDEIVSLTEGALLHDIGKILLPGDLWCIPVEVDEDEKEIIEKHPLLGANILRECQFEEKVIEIVKYHHEFWDGNGYPEQLKGDEIPLTARIVGLAEAYISMISYDIYSDSLTKEDAMKIIREEKGKQFDPVVVDSFLKII